MYNSSNDIEEIIWRHKFTLPKVSPTDPTIEAFIEEVKLLSAFTAFLGEVEKDVIIMKEVEL